MSMVPLFTISFSKQLNSIDLKNLEIVLSTNSVKLQSFKERGEHLSLVLLIERAIVTDASGTADKIHFGIQVVKSIISWLKELQKKDLLQEKDVKTDCILGYPHRPPLDISTASDEEIEEWLRH